MVLVVRNGCIKRVGFGVNKNKTNIDILKESIKEADGASKDCKAGKVKAEKKISNKRYIIF